MRRIFTIISLGLLMTSLSCTKEQAGFVERGEGILSLDMNLEGQTRAVSEDELRNSAQVKIYKADFSGLVRIKKGAEKNNVTIDGATPVVLP